jgi:hypothetical protein
MSEHPDTGDANPAPLATPVSTPAAEQHRETNWQLRIVLILLAIVALVGVYLWGVNVMPRWWAHRVGKKVDGSLTAGTLYGLFIGFVFTLLPLIVLRQAFRRMPVGARVVLLVIAVALAVPNLLTLGIVLGNGNAAHAGDRILDVDGPGFRAGSAWGAIIAIAAVVALFVGLWRWRRDRRHLKELRVEKAERERAARDDEQQR